MVVVNIFPVMQVLTFYYGILQMNGNMKEEEDHCEESFVEKGYRKG